MKSFVANDGETSINLRYIATSWTQFMQQQVIKPLHQ